MRRFFAAPEQFAERTVTLTAEETRHLRDVLRMKVGEQARIFDGEGQEFLCEISAIGKSSATLKVVRGVEPSAPESALELTLVVSAYKADHLDAVARMAVELGVAGLVPIVTHRSEIKLKDAQKRVDRWRKIAMEATKQCERARLMKVDDVLEFADFAACVTEHDGTLLIFSEKGGGPIPDRHASKNVTALIGPKGGWEDSELELANQKGFAAVKLGSRIMKADTAAVTFAALLQHRFGDLT